MHILYFGAKWCGPCRLISATMEDVLSSGKIKKIDVDEFPEEVKYHRIKAIPTFIKVDDNGNEVARKSGLISKSELIDFMG